MVLEVDTTTCLPKPVIMSMHGSRIFILLLLGVLLGGCTLPAHRPVIEPAGWSLVWSDEFDGTQVEPTKWDFELGNGFFVYAENQWVPGWGNRELQYYTREPANVFVRDGLLHMRALKEGRDGFGYTSVRLATRKRDGGELFSKAYGRFEFRAKLPVGQGLWPALWLMPQDSKYGPWPASGEIDVMEARGQLPTVVNGTAHFDTRFSANAVASHKTYTFPAGHSIADFHVYAVEWEPGEIRWLVDNTVFRTENFWWSARQPEGAKGVQSVGLNLNPWPAPFDQPFYILMNLAVGGDYLGNPDKTTPFPAEMLVDYVRVYDKVGGYGPVRRRGQGALPAGMQER